MKRKSIKHLVHINGQVIRYKNGSVSLVSTYRKSYVDIFYNIDIIEIVIDKTNHPVWSYINMKLVKK